MQLKIAPKFITKFNFKQNLPELLLFDFFDFLAAPQGPKGSPMPGTLSDLPASSTICN
jgi:hypothetical protein